jgi:hypothetical protein
LIGLLRVNVLKVPSDSAFVTVTPLALLVETIVGVISERPPVEISISTLETDDPVSLDCKIILGSSTTITVGGNRYPLPPLEIPTFDKVKLFLTSINVGISAFAQLFYPQSNYIQKLMQIHF